MSAAMMHETIWFDKKKYDEAEDLYQSYLNGPSASPPKSAPVLSSPKTEGSTSSSAKEIAEARRKIQQSLSAAPSSSSSAVTSDSEKRLTQLEAENKILHKKIEDLTEALQKLEQRVFQLESGKLVAAPTATPAVTPAVPIAAPAAATAAAPVADAPAVPAAVTPADTPAKETKKEESEDEDDVDLFGSSSEEEDEAYEKIKEERLAAYNAKKAKKPQVIAKSSIVIDVKPWDDQTDIAELEAKVRSVQTDGLLWGASKIIPIAYGIKKLQISCVVEDDKCGTDYLEEKISEFEDLVQSIDTVAFNKI